jgi:hypothetical protein
MMRNGNLKAAPGFLLLVFAALACNLPGGSSPTAPPSLATLTPFPTQEFTQAEFEPDPEFFVEEFDQGLPETWNAAPGWRVGSGMLSTTRSEAELEIPGTWQDFSLFSHLRFESEGVALQIKRSETGAYQIDLSREAISLSWQPNQGELESLVSAPFTIDPGWHDLVLRYAQGQVEVILDQQPVLKHSNLGLSPAGSFKLITSGAGLLEIERIVVAPPGG